MTWRLKGGIERSTGSKISVLTNKLPACARPGDHIIEIEGNVLAVKKALVAVSHHLQDGTLSDKPKAPSGEQTFSNTGNTSSGYSSGVHPSSTESDKTYRPDKRIQQEVTFRILCSHERAGGIIGTHGTIVKDLERQSGAKINFGPLVTDCEERLITITALENPDMELPSPAQKALVLVFARSVEAGFEKGSNASSSKSTVTARLVILRTQAGCLLGKGGAIVREMKKASGAKIWVIQDGQIPKCVSENDNVVEISGEFLQVKDAISRVASRLHGNLFSNITNSTGTSNGKPRDAGPPGQDPPVNNSSNPEQHSTTTQNSGISGTSPKGDFNRGSMTVVKVTVELALSGHDMDAVCGENGSNLEQLRQISGAKVTVHKLHAGTNDFTIVISGKPEETQSAQNYLEQYIIKPS